MKHFKLFTLASLVLFSCVEEFDLHLGEFEPKLVVEGVITNKSGPHYIRLTKSNTGAFIKPDYSYSDNAEPVMNATIIISDNGGQIDTLVPIDINIEEYLYDYNIGYFKLVFDEYNEIIDTMFLEAPPEYRHDRGFYKTRCLKGIPERTYYLKVITTDGTIYNAFDYMPLVPQIDSIGYHKKILEKDGQEYFVPLLYFREFQEVDNYYLIQLIDEESSRTFSAHTAWRFSILSDKYLEPYVNGLNIDNGASAQGSDFYYFVTGDSIHVTMSSLSSNAYNYYKNLIEQFENDGGAYKPTPASPPTNISNGGLGFFRASSVVEAKTIIKY